MYKKSAKLTDIELLTRYLNGSVTAFESFYQKYNDNVFRFVIAMVGDSSIAEEIAAVAWEKFITNCGSINAEPRAYLFSIVRNETNSHFRLNKKMNLCTTTDINALVIEESHSNAADIDKLMGQLNALPFKQKEAILLKHLAGFSLDELALHQQVNSENAKSRLRYAMKKIRRTFIQVTS